MKKCAVVVVTYNRAQLLRENLEALLQQTFSDFDILLIDNASTDGTVDVVRSFSDPRIRYFNTGKNVGGSGGFAIGMEKSLQGRYAYSWLMDDDSIPEKDALESLIRKADLVKDEFSFMASLVHWTDGKVFPMNYPKGDYKHTAEIDHVCISKYHLIPIGTCSFVGCFVNNAVAQKTWLPIREFFIYGDDVEYTYRLRAFKQAYLDTTSVILHKTASIQGADIASAPAEKIDRYYCQSRNGMYNARKRGAKSVLVRITVIGHRFMRILHLAPDHKAKRIWVLLKGSFAGIFFSPVKRYADLSSEEEKP